MFSQACVKNSVHGGRHAWQGGMRDVLVCVARGVCMAGGVHGGGLHGGGHVWWGACMVGGVHGGGVVLCGGMRGRGGGYVWWGHAWHACPPPHRILRDTLGQ